jgi:prophage regulatory protein
VKLEIGALCREPVGRPSSLSQRGALAVNRLRRLFCYQGLAGMSQTLIPFDALKAKGITLSKVQIWRLEKIGKFPKRVSVSAARHAWVETEIDAMISARIAARQQVVAL